MWQSDFRWFMRLLDWNVMFWFTVWLFISGKHPTAQWVFLGLVIADIIGYSECDKRNRREWYEDTEFLKKFSTQKEVSK